MMPGNIYSQQQAAFFGAVCSGKARNKPKGLSEDKACESLRGVQVSKLPKSSNKRKKGKVK